MRTDTQSSTDQPNLDPNLQLQQQRQVAPTDGAALPPPPPPPGTTMATASTTSMPAPPPMRAPGAASDVGAPSTPTGTATLPSSSSTSAPTAPTGTGPTYSAGDTAFSGTILPNADPRLTSTRQLVNSAAGNLANVDRVQLAKDAFKTFQSETDPAYQASLRDAMRAGAAGGQVGSGQLRTHFGDLALQRQRDLQNEQDRLVQGATEGSISDAFNKLGALSGLEGQVYGENAGDRNELRTEREQRLGNGLSLLQAGDAGNPADYYAEMARQLKMDPSALSALARSIGYGPTATPPITSTTTPPPVPAGYIDDTRSGNQAVT